MSNFYGVPFAELHYDKATVEHGAILRCEFKDACSVTVPAHEGLTGLFRAVENFVTSQAIEEKYK
jgi:hypothetical protein